MNNISIDYKNARCNDKKSVAYEIKWKYTVVPGRPHMTIWRMRITCWIPKVTNTLRLRNTHYFSTATKVARTHLSVVLWYFLC
jgi:hypothetical protein